MCVCQRVLFGLFCFGLAWLIGFVSFGLIGRLVVLFFGWFACLFSIAYLVCSVNSSNNNNNYSHDNHTTEGNKGEDTKSKQNKGTFENIIT